MTADEDDGVRRPQRVREPQEGPRPTGEEPPAAEEPPSPAEPVPPAAAAAPGRPGPNFFTIGFTGALGVLTAWMLAQALVQARSILVYILVALFLAVGLNPVIEFLGRRFLPRWAAIAAVCAGLVVFVAGFVWAIVPPLTQQVADIAADFPGYLRGLQGNEAVADLDERFEILRRLEDAVVDPDFGRQVFGGLVGVGQIVVNSVAATFTVLVLTLFFMSSLPGITEVSYRLVPRSRRAGVRELGDEILERIGGYIAGQLLVALLGGVVAFVFLSLTGSDYALTLALIVAVTALIPLIGTTIGALAASVVVGVGDLGLGVATLVFFFVYQQIESYVIAPRVMQRSVDVAPTVTITAALLGGALMGLVGALIAIPAAAAVTLVLKRVVFPRLEER
ncbi:AI-2E family transporter [Actinorugispora endophytica]|uniref:Putative PurR-regulated permease PerM n=1 Tax=Actinorugispora endophytica TaxID=1605990 RepID=A0A4R6UGE5_9ACTN|nr:AI-2E family transporter [Actinorugispora endophytica]TDQ45881.1 putative PurR-regulated permease PerM [Actinorugispora endophytica]